MSRTAYTLLLVFVVAFGANLLAQQKNKAGAKQTEHAARRAAMPNAYLGHSDYRGGPLQKDAFISLMKQGLTAHDSLGKTYKVTGFDFSYAEQKLYEDSAGNVVMMMDMSSEYCDGDTLASDIAYARHMLTSAYLTDSADIPKGLYERIKPGDSLFFDHIKVVECAKNAALSLSDTTTVAAKGMKFFIVK